MSAVTIVPQNCMSDDDRALALQTVFLQDAHEDADRMEALASEWLFRESGITPECEEAWYEYVGAWYANRTHMEEIEDLDEEKFIALYGSIWTALHFERTTSRDNDDYIWWPCYGEQLGDAYDPDADYSYHGTML